MPFDFAAARKPYQCRSHPRLLVGHDDLDRLRQRTKTGIGKTIMVALRRKAAHFADQIHADDRWIERLATGMYFWPRRDEGFAWALPDMALVGVLDRDERAIDAVRKVLGQLSQTPVTPRQGGLVAADYYMPPVFVPHAYDLIASELNDSDRRRLVRWAVAAHIREPIARRRGRYLKMAAHNMTLGGMVQALTTLLAVKGDPSAPNLEAEQAQLLQWFEATLHTAIGPDGYPEEDMGYGTVVAPSLAILAEALTRAGLFDAFAPGSQASGLAAFGNAMLHFVQPWGEHLSNTGDHGDQLRERQFSLARLATRTHNPALLWLLGTLTYTHSRTFITDPVPDLEPECQPRPGYSVPVSWLSLVVLDDLAKPVPPTIPRIATAYRDRARGIVSFRSGWRDDDTFVVFDGSQRSPSAPGHYHESCGHFSLSALGEYFAIDTGRYNVEQTCHNVVLIDGKSGRSTGGDWTCTYHPGRLTAYEPGEFVDTAAVDSSHQHGCMWAWRWMGLVKGEEAPAYAWVVDDINKANDWGEFWWQLHSSPENRIAIHGRRATITGWRKGNHMDVHFAIPPTKAYRQPHTLRLEQDTATVSSVNYVKDAVTSAQRFARPADMLHGPVIFRPRLIAKVAGYNGRMLSLMLPRPKGERPARVRQVQALNNSLAMRITFDKVEDTLIWAYEHRLLEANGIKARGQWCVVRRARRGGRVIRFTGGDLTAIEVDGKAMRFVDATASRAPRR